MDKTLCRSQNWSNDDPPPSYTEVVRLECWPQLPSAWQNVSSGESPYLALPPSYSSLDLPSLTPECSPAVIPKAEDKILPKDPDLSSLTSEWSPTTISITEAKLLPKDPPTTVVTRKQFTHSGGGVPSYIAWSIVTTIIFPPLGVIALILSLTVLIAQQKNNPSVAWKYHVIVRRVNLVATVLALCALLFFAIFGPLTTVR